MLAVVTGQKAELRRSNAELDRKGRELTLKNADLTASVKREEIARRSALKLAANLNLNHGQSAIQHEHDIPTATLWFAEAFRIIEDGSPATRFSARSLLCGWSRSLPVHSLQQEGIVFEAVFSPDARALATVSDVDYEFGWTTAVGRAVRSALRRPIPAFRPVGSNVVQLRRSNSRYRLNLRIPTTVARASSSAG